MTLKPLDEIVEVDVPAPDFYPAASVKYKMSRGDLYTSRAIAIAIGAICGAVLAYSFYHNPPGLPPATAIRGAVAP